MKDELKKRSKFLSLVLRHKPEEIGLVLDEQGWANVEELLKLLDKAGKPTTRELLDRVVAENDKKRFAFSGDGTRIRASQGHSVEIDLDLPPSTPPAMLYHGTATRFLDSILEKGLVPGSRRHVHLSVDIETATKVGARHGKPAILTVDAAAMHRAGHVFFVSANGVWLTDAVPREFIGFGAA